MSVQSKIEGLFCELNPAFGSYLGFFHLRLYTGDFGLQAGFLFEILLIVDHIPQAHLGEIIELFLGFIVRPLLCFIDLGTFVHFHAVLFSEYVECPLSELGHNREPVYLGFDNLLDLFYIRVVLLGAGPVLTGADAVIEDVALESACLLDELLLVSG